MTALCRMMSIVHLSLAIPMRWLSGNRNRLSEHGWNVRSMGRTIDMLEAALMIVQDDEMLMIDEQHMMSIFSDIENEIPPLKEFLEYVHEDKMQKAISGFNSENSKIKEIPHAVLRKELFEPSKETNVETDVLC